MAEQALLQLEKQLPNKAIEQLCSSSTRISLYKEAAFIQRLLSPNLTISLSYWSHWRYGWLEFSRWDCPWWRYVYYISILVFTDTTVTSEAFSRFMHVLLGLYLWVFLTCPSLIDNSHPYYSWEFATSLDFDYQFLTGKKSFRWPLVSELLLLIHCTHPWSDFLFRRSICPAFYANRNVSQQSIASIIKLISH